ncbi:hypothetical protein COMNV_01439 [Commensalibacter sp. Nvir]|uniref:alginate export family protein n=1 Tax=Commensalibacter sp. Nvir TaxID=3069817 RepID=UPI002D3A9415|nr:hypothetical protein COMNV_01439 [Commensalibacter sp. Nvir]
MNKHLGLTDYFSQIKYFFNVKNNKRYLFLILCSNFIAITYPSTSKAIDQIVTQSSNNVKIEAPSSTRSCKNVVTAFGKYGRSRHPDYGVFNANSGFGPVGNYSWYAFGKYAPYGEARWAEDWSGLCNDPEANKDWFNKLKYIPLNDSGNIWISFNGNERFRYAYDSKPYMGFLGKTDSNRLLMRSLYGADLHLGSHVRAYAEIINAVAGGSNTFGYQTGFQRKRLDLQQGFLELKANILGAKTGVMGGRQFFVDAPPSMISPRELTNVRQSWDGVRGYAIWDRFRISTFDFFQTDLTDRDIFGYGPSYNARLYGGYASWALPKFYALGKQSQIFLDPFFIGYLYNGGSAAIPMAPIGTWQQGSSRRDNMGGRLSGNLGVINFDFTGVYQGGEFRLAKSSASRPVEAYAFNSIFSYLVPNIPGKLSLGLQSDYFSGGNYNKTHGAVHNFAVPYFAAANYLDMTLYLTTSNSISTGPFITYNPTPKTFVRFHAPVIWRASTNDTLYGIGFNYGLRDNYSGGFVGAMHQLSLAYAIAPHLVLSSEYAGFIGSSSIKRAGAKDGSFFMQTLDFRF